MVVFELALLDNEDWSDELAVLLILDAWLELLLGRVLVLLTETLLVDETRLVLLF